MEVPLLVGPPLALLPHRLLGKGLSLHLAEFLN